MRRMILIGRSGCGKTTLMQALNGEAARYRKTQYIHYHDRIFDTPGEYAENHSLSAALALYSYEADVVGLLLSATEPYSLYPPNITCLVNREVVGIVTKIDRAEARPERAALWLRNSGCKTVFFVNSISGDGVQDILRFLQNEKKEARV